MAASKPEVLIIQVICVKYSEISLEFLGISTATPTFFGVWQSNATIENATRFNRKCEVQDGGHKAGSNDVSARR